MWVTLFSQFFFFQPFCTRPSYGPRISFTVLPYSFSPPTMISETFFFHEHSVRTSFSGPPHPPSGYRQAFKSTNCLILSLLSFYVVDRYCRPMVPACPPPVEPFPFFYWGDTFSPQPPSYSHSRLNQSCFEIDSPPPDLLKHDYPSQTPFEVQVLRNFRRSCVGWNIFFFLIGY